MANGSPSQFTRTISPLADGDFFGADDADDSNNTGKVAGSTIKTYVNTDPLITNDMTFDTTGARILGDFSNATLADRVSFMNATANSETFVQAIPNGVSFISGFWAYGDSDPDNAPALLMTATSAGHEISSVAAGTGVLQVLNFQMGGSTVWSIETDGTFQSAAGENIEFTGTGNRILGDFNNATLTNRVSVQTSNAGFATRFSLLPNGSGEESSFIAYGQSDPANSGSLDVGINDVAGFTHINSTKTGTGTQQPLQFQIAGTVQWTMDTSGNLTGASGNDLTLAGALNADRTATAVSVNSAGETFIGVTSNAAARTITLDTDDVVDGRVIIIKDEAGTAGSTNNITIATEAAETIDGAASITIVVDYGVARLYSDGTNWFTF